MAEKAAGLLATLALLGTGCLAPMGWVDVGSLETRYPAIAEQGGHRLAEFGPHFWIAGAELLEFVCLWPGGESIPVSLAGTPTGAERQLVERAVEVLGPVIGRSFVVQPSAGPDSEAPQRGIAVEFIDGPDPEDPGRMSLTAGDAIADCRVDAPLAAAFGGSSLPAQLVYASVRVRRSRADALGRVRPLGEVELLATLLHELGHALGYSTHSRGGETVMRLAPSEVRRLARPVAAGRPLHDATLSALYALDSGAIVRRGPVPPQALTTLRVCEMLARATNWSSAFTRSGARSAEVWWRSPDGERIALIAPRPVPGESWSGIFALNANRAGREALRAN
ncbi:MAG: hypothetical protein VX246_14985 [Myxococcota bacterium]|nr:hypothetical protein [Myxococcota bacterium]